MKEYITVEELTACLNAMLNDPNFIAAMDARVAMDHAIPGLFKDILAILTHDKKEY